jgi:hypothetical protein
MLEEMKDLKMTRDLIYTTMKKLHKKEEARDRIKFVREIALKLPNKNTVHG